MELQVTLQVEFLLLMLSKCNQDPKPAVSETNVFWESYTFIYSGKKVLISLSTSEYLSCKF